MSTRPSNRTDGRNTTHRLHIPSHLGSFVQDFSLFSVSPQGRRRSSLLTCLFTCSQRNNRTSVSLPVCLARSNYLVFHTFRFQRGNSPGVLQRGKGQRNVKKRPPSNTDVPKSFSGTGQRILNQSTTTLAHYNHSQGQPGQNK